MNISPDNGRNFMKKLMAILVVRFRISIGGGCIHRSHYLIRR